MKSIVYLMHGNSEQLDLWLQNLSSDNIELVDVPPTNDIVNVLEDISSSNLPSLILLEMSIQCPGSNLLQASKVSRWCKDNHPSTQIIFLTNRREAELTKLEQRWAIKQGAICLLPRLDQDNLTSQVNQIYGYLNLEVPIRIFEAIPEIFIPVPIDISKQGLDDAKLLIEKKDFAGAMNQLKEVIQKNKESIDAYLLCGEIFTYLKNLEKAIQAYSEAISIDPKHGNSYYKRGLTYNRLKNYHASISDFNLLIKLEPNFPEAYNARGLARKGLGDIEGARLDYNNAIAINPSYAEAYLNRGMLLYSVGEQTGARHDYEQAVKLDAQYEGSYFSWANNSEIKGLSVF